jgi:hypothetical protein
METDPVPETFCFNSLKYWMTDKFQKLNNPDDPDFFIS